MSSTRQVGRIRRRADRSAGIYVHIPFCARLCPYCDFAVAVRREIPHQIYTDALLAEWEARRHEVDGRRVVSIYYGGGTPSLLSPAQLRRLHERISRSVELADDVEVTLEANPASVDPRRLQTWKEIGVNRLSLGVQSFEDRYLEALGRNHDGARAREALRWSLDLGPDNVSADLIFAGPEHDLAEWRKDLAVLQHFDELSHVSAYHLTVEERTVFHRKFARGELRLPDDDVAVDMLDALEETCRQMGMARYEVSNFGAPGAWSRHNTNYWTGAEYLGLGTGSHSFQIADGVAVRRVNERNLKRYSRDPENFVEVEELSPSQHLVERLFLGVRTRRGIRFDALEEQFQGAVDAAELEAARRCLEGLVAEDFLELDAASGEDGDVFRPTRSGFLFGDEMAARFADVLPR